jgi:hypothetical protein
VLVSHISLAGDDPAVGERRLIADAVTQLSQIVGVSACPEALSWQPTPVETRRSACDPSADGSTLHFPSLSMREEKSHAAFGLSGFPGLVVIDRTGRVRLTREGYNSSEISFRTDLTQLLRSLTQ